MVSPPLLYLALGVGPLERQAAYRASFATEGDPEVLRPLRAFLQAGTPLGNDRIRLQIEQARGVKVDYAARGATKARARSAGRRRPNWPSVSLKGDPFSPSLKLCV